MHLMVVLLASMAAHATARAVPTPVPSVASLESEIRDGLRTWRNWIQVEDGTCGPYWRVKTPDGGARLGTQECRFRGDRGITLWHPFGHDAVTVGGYIDRRAGTALAFFFQEENGTLHVGRTAQAGNVVVDENKVLRLFQLVLLDESEQVVFSRTFTQ